MRRRGLEAHSSDSEESEGEVSPLGSSESEDSESEGEAPVLARRRGARREEDEGEEGGAPESQQSDSDVTDTEDEDDDDVSDEETRPAPTAIAKRPPTAGAGRESVKGGAGRGEGAGGRGRGRGRGRGDAQRTAQKATTAEPSGGRGRGGARGKAPITAPQPQSQQQQQQSNQGGKKLVYRPKNAAGPAADDGSAANSDAAQMDKSEEQWGDMTSSPAPARASGRGSRPARGKKGNRRDRINIKKEDATPGQEIAPPEGEEAAQPLPKPHEPRPQRGRKQAATRVPATKGGQSNQAAPATIEEGSAEDGAEPGEGEEGAAGEEGGLPKKDTKKKPDPDDPQFVPRGRFFMHDDRYGGGKGPGPRPRARPEEAHETEQEEIWMHDGYERLEREERDGRKGRNRRRGKQAAGGRGGAAAPAEATLAEGGVDGSVAPSAPVAGPQRGEPGAKRGKGKGQRQPGGGRGHQQAGAAHGQDHAAPAGNGAVAGPPAAGASSKRYSSQRVAATDESASLAAKAVAAAVSSTGAPINPTVPGGGHFASSPIRPNAQPFRPKGRGGGASTLYVPMGYNPYVPVPPEYGAGATYYPPPAFPAYGYPQGGQFPDPTTYLEPDPAIIDASVPTYQMPAAVPPSAEEGGPDPTMMNPQLTPYGAYPPPFFYTGPVYHPYMADHQSGGGRGRGRGRGHHHGHMAAPPLQGTVYYPPPPPHVDGEALQDVVPTYEMAHEEGQGFDPAETIAVAEHVATNGDGDESVHFQREPAVAAPSASPVGGSKMRAKAPKWVPKAAATNANSNGNGNGNGNASVGRESAVETAAS